MDAFSVYGNKIRIRACGICTDKDGILLINFLGLRDGDFWSPPGGGVEFGETAEECVKREFEEETRLIVTVGKFLFACEYINDPLHAIELFFEINSFTGELALGTDPETNKNVQHIHAVKFFSWKELKVLPKGSLHGIFGIVDHPSEIKNLSGYFKV